MLHINIPFLLSMGGGPIDSWEKLIAHIVVFGLALLAFLSLPAAVAAFVLIVSRRKDDTTVFDRRLAETGMKTSHPKRHGFQFNMRGILFVSLLALSFGLLWKAYLVRFDFKWLVLGLCVLGGTLGYTIERRCNAHRTGTVWMLISIFLGFLSALCVIALTAR
jgi:hypothetical protein